jgi:hypothetical protein
VVADHLAQLLGRRQRAGADRRQPRLGQRHRAMEDCREQILLGPEMAVHGRLRHAEPARQLVQGRGAVAARAKQLGGRAENLGAQQLAARRARAHASQWWQAMQSSGACVPRVAFSRR